MITVDVSSFFGAGGGGIRTYYEAKARWLPATGAECHFVVPGPHRATERFGGGWLHRVPGPPIGAGYRAFGDLAELRRIVRSLEPDVLELASHYLLPQLVASAWRRRPAIVGFYHADFPTTYVAPRVAKLPELARRAAIAAAWSLVRRQHGRYDATLAGSRAVEVRLAAAGVPRVRWVGLGVDPDAFDAPRDRADAGRASERRLGYLGRLATEKELALVLEAAPAIERATGARIAVAGDGPAAAHVDAAVRLGQLDALGALPRADVPGFLRGLDALIVPGRYETFSLAAAEALAAGTPVIAARQGGARELVERSGGGLTFRPGDAGALAEAVRAYYALPAAERVAMGERGRRYVRELHAWPRVIERVRRAYDDARRDAIRGGARCWS